MATGAYEVIVEQVWAKGITFQLTLTDLALAISQNLPLPQPRLPCKRLGRFCFDGRSIFRFAKAARPIEHDEIAALLRWCSGESSGDLRHPQGAGLF